ncbi:MAG: guanylate kinase [Sedimentisphaeraceae bacterium JB056]
MSNKGRLIVLSGPSGVGKGTIVSQVVKQYDLQLSISATTRQPGKGEQNGVNYWFMDRCEFEEMVEKGQFLEYADVFGNLYGTRKDKTDQMLEQGKPVILEIDVQGGLQVKDKYPDAVMIFILPPDMQQLEQRIRGRGRDTEDTIKVRLAKAQKEIEIGKEHYTHFVVNDKLEDAVNNVIEIIKTVDTGKNAC